MFTEKTVPDPVYTPEEIARFEREESRLKILDTQYHEKMAALKANNQAGVEMVREENEIVSESGDSMVSDGTKLPEEPAAPVVDITTQGQDAVAPEMAAEPTQAQDLDHPPGVE